MTIERLGTLPFKAQPGDAFVYGYNTDILGYIVEKASGSPLDEYLRSHITGPLGRSDTMFYRPADKAKRLAVVYGSGPDGKIVNTCKGCGTGDFPPCCKQCPNYGEPPAMPDVDEL